MTKKLTQKEAYEMLREQVQEHWTTEGTDWLETNAVPSDPFYIDYEFLVKPKYIQILKDKERCAQELGFNSFAEYKKYLEETEI